MSDSTLLEEIRENFDTAVREWQDIRDEGNEDMRIIADGPWTEQERKERKIADRPCLAFDELSQYTSQAVGDFRQNKRAIKVTPKGNGATDDTAAKRAGMIREIEYNSQAQTAYSTGFESLVKRSYGFWKLGTKYCSPTGSDQELTISAISNPDTVLLDPFAKKLDWSDMDYGFLIDSYSERQFKKRWSDAEIQSFAGEEMEIAPAWITATRIQVAEYWRDEKTARTQLTLDMGEETGPSEKFLDELPKGSKVQDSSVYVQLNGQTHKVPLLSHRKTETSLIVQYITNGLEILEKNVTKWKEIPIIAVFGPEEYVNVGGGSKKRLLSMVRKARDAYKAYCYCRTNEVEVIGMVPKVLYMGYEGQFATSTPWTDVNKVAIAYGEVKATTPGTGQTVLPLPERQPYDPPVQSLEMAAASFRMAIQSAMGVGNGMVSGKSSQSLDAKSGKAIEALDRQEAQGSFVYIANWERGLERTGRLIEDALDWCYDTPREVGVRSPSDAYSSEKINQPVQGKDGQTTQFNTNAGDHGVTISTGPSDQSTRDAADGLVEQIIAMPGAPPKAIALAIKLKNVGPIGDELAKIFDPEEPDPHAAQMQIQELSQKLKTTQGFAQSLHEQIETKAAENATKLEIARMQEETKRVIGLATINAQQAQQKFDQELGIISEKVDRVHDANLLLTKQAHEKEMAANAQEAARATQESAQQHQGEQATQAQRAAAEAQQRDQEAAAAAAEQQPKAA